MHSFLQVFNRFQLGYEYTFYLCIIIQQLWEH